jgi:hypothetical protein
MWFCIPPILYNYPFSANEELQKMGYDPVDWNVDGDLPENSDNSSSSSSKKILVDV